MNIQEEQPSLWLFMEDWCSGWQFYWLLYPNIAFLYQPICKAIIEIHKKVSSHCKCPGHWPAAPGTGGWGQGSHIEAVAGATPHYPGLICNKDCALTSEECSSYVFTLSEINDTKQTLTFTGTYSFILGNNVDQFRLVVGTPPSLCKGAKISLSVG